MHTLAQAASHPAANHATSLIEQAKQNGWYPLLVIGGIIALIAIFVLLAKMKRDS